MVSSTIDVIIVLDTSSNVKILDYRVMKELLKNFLSEHFNLGRNRVRVGVIKYGDCSEVSLNTFVQVTMTMVLLITVLLIWRDFGHKS